MPGLQIDQTEWIQSRSKFWQAVSASRPSSATHFMGMHQSLGIQLAAQLGKDASAAVRLSLSMARKIFMSFPAHY
jgi:hypothetical protein